MKFLNFSFLCLMSVLFAAETKPALDPVDAMLTNHNNEEMFGDAYTPDSANTSTSSQSKGKEVSSNENAETIPTEASESWFSKMVNTVKNLF